MVLVYTKFFKYFYQNKDTKRYEIQLVYISKDSLLIPKYK